MDFSRFKFKIFALEALFFTGAFAVGILSVLRIKEITVAQKEIAVRSLSNTAVNLPPDLANLGNLSAPAVVTVGQFLIAFLFVTVFILFLIKTKYGGKILKAFFVIAIFAGAEIIFRVWAGDIAAAIFAFVLVAARYMAPRIIIHNIAIIAAIAGVAINFGLTIDPFDTVLLLVIISVYDFLAVYKTGHMVKMFKSTVSAGTVFAMIVPDRFSNLFKSVQEAESGRDLATHRFVPNAFVYLGGGDLAFPLILGISAAMKYGTGSAIFVLFGSILGLLALNIIFAAQKETRPMPALPALAVFSILGFLASLVKI